MQCPSCKEINKDKVIDSRLSDGGKVVRRRRECTSCGRRYTTKERLEEEPRITVIKKDGSRMPFDPQRVLRGMRQASYKRPISQEALEKVVEQIEEEVVKNFDREVPSQVIGGLAAKHLRKIDPVAYLRFASVYLEFKDLNDMMDEIEFVKDEAAELSPGQKSLFE